MGRESDPITQEEIALALTHMSERVALDRRRMLDPIVRASLRRILVALERLIPGLEPPPDAAAAHELASSAAAALIHNREREALARSLRGLSFAPHSPELHYLAATACLELGAVREALCLLSHTLWIHPGHPLARRDFETLTACRGVWEPSVGADASESDPETAVEPSPFELMIEEWEEPMGVDGDFWASGEAWADEPRRDEPPREDGEWGDDPTGDWRRAA